MLIQHGDDDKVVKISGAKLIMQHNKNSDKALNIYKGRHMVTHDVEILKVLKDLNEWIDKRSTPHCQNCKKEEKDGKLVSFGCRHYPFVQNVWRNI